MEIRAKAKLVESYREQKRKQDKAELKELLSRVVAIISEDYETDVLSEVENLLAKV